MSTGPMNLPHPYALASVGTRAGRQTAFIRTAPVDLTRIFTGWGPLPAVVASSEQTGDWDAPGQTRTVSLSDGSEAQERLTGYAAPDSFAYTVTPRTGLLSVLVREARGQWWFLVRADGGTDIWWRYEFRPRAVWAWPLLLLVAALWEAYIRQALRLLVREIERPN